MSENLKDVRYGFVDENNVLQHIFIVKENDSTTIDRLKIDFSCANAYPIDFEKELASVGVAFWNGNRFLLPSPYPSWVFDEDLNEWTPPIPKPDSSNWTWNEDIINWVEIEQSAPPINE